MKEFELQIKALDIKDKLLIINDKCLIPMSKFPKISEFVRSLGGLGVFIVPCNLENVKVEQIDKAIEYLQKLKEGKSGSDCL